MVKVENLHISYDSFAIKNISFEVAKGEYFMLLGESGAGKSVILESIAGLCSIAQGSIFLNNKIINNTAIQKRKVGLVFQDFALFPHLSVSENICFPLKVKKYKKAIIQEKLNSLACELNIDHLLDRKVETLSGGEKQRVALARTLTLDPDVLLLDEPLSAIDVSLKGELRRILRRLNKKGQTIIHVTHDYEEAISLAHKIGIIHNGELIQAGTPKEVFTHPKNRFVAHFGGIKNFFEAKIEEQEGSDTLIARPEENVTIEVLTKLRAKNGYILINQKNIILSKEAQEATNINQYKGTIQEIIPARFGFELVIESGIQFYVSVTAQNISDIDYSEGEEVWVAFNPSAVKFIPI